MNPYGFIYRNNLDMALNDPKVGDPNFGHLREIIFFQYDNLIFLKRNCVDLLPRLSGYSQKKNGHDQSKL